MVVVIVNVIAKAIAKIVKVDQIAIIVTVTVVAFVQNTNIIGNNDSN